MTEGMEDLSTGPAPPPGSATPTTGSTDDTGQVPEEKPEETEAAGASGAEGAEGGGDDGDGEHLGAVGIVALPGTCCVCVEMEQINNCLHSEKICILPILACLLSLALCTAGLKWVFVDKIFEYEPPTHLEPKRIGQDPFIISVDPTLGITLSVSHPSPSTVSLTTAAAVTPGRPEVLVEELSTRGPNVPQSPGATQSDPAVTLKYNAERPTVPRQTPRPPSTQEVNDIDVPTISAASTTTTTKISSHVTRCSHSQRNYCVNGGECFTLEITPGSTKFLCRCPNEFTGDRCQNYVMASFYKAEELYQKRILTISGICIALLVVGIMCVVAYCKTKRRRKELHDRLRQSLRNKRNNNTNTGVGPNLATSARGRQISNLPLQDLQLINQCNGTTMKHAAEKEAETETTFSTSKYEPTTFTHISSQRFVNSPASPASPPSEMSAPLSSLAVSVPSVALSPSGEEERPLLLRQANTKSSGRDEQKRSSAHYNHGHVAHSLPSSPLFATDNATNYQVTGNHDDDDAAGAAGQTFSETIGHTNNNVPTEREGVTNGHLLRDVASSVSDVEEEEEFAPFLTTGHRLLLRAMHSSRTNSASCDDDVLVKSSTNKLHPVAAV
ncbi:pro-neuregulin-1, membrane-bound isoform isoform X3 [Scophthalmus maximus]|uniref:pro-neuregulin-1, membrane-bound isoform isoform X3 n=1 Tax=Scophthalmus maximus TaxID=52904 RepID=UPI001FA88A1F|nr:pro-neuregulin-1, membrane-bound isoform isoform X3 [Scophthalmus maximus]